METLWSELAHLWVPALRLVLVLLAGGLIGWEREAADKTAGLRTHTMVGLGAALFTLAAQRVLQTSAVGDPTRIMAGIAQGIGFLGAGTILKERQRIRGLTTAATIWMMGALGMAWGMGAYGLATVATLATFVVLRPFKRLERAARPRGGRAASGGGAAKGEEG